MKRKEYPFGDFVISALWMVVWVLTTKGFLNLGYAIGLTGANL